MGCFKVNCSISKLPIISETEVVCISLNKSIRLKFESMMDRGNYFLVYPYDYYVPMTLPIIGKYNDYGFIEDIQKDENTETIEKYFNMTIEDFVHPDKKPKDTDAGMFIHKEIYDYLINRKVTNCFGETLDRNTLGKQFDLIQNSLNKLKDMNQNRMEIYQIEGVYIENYNRINDEIEKIKQYENPFHFILKTGFYIPDHPNVSGLFQDIYSPEVKQGKLKEQFIDFLFLEYALWDTGSHYGPAFYPGQEYIYDDLKKLYQKSLEIVQRGIDEIE